MATKEREIETYDTSSFLQRTSQKVAMGAVGSFAYRAKHLIQTQPVQGLVKVKFLMKKRNFQES